MKIRRAAALLIAFSMVLTLGGCGNTGRRNQKNTFGNAGNGIYLFRNLSVKDCQIYSFEKDYYSDSEFKTYLEKDLDEYNKAHAYHQPETMVPATDKDGETLETVGPQAEKPIEVLTCEKKDEKLYQSLLYATPEDFILYNEEEVTKRGGTALQAGKLTEADRSVLGETYTAPDGNAFDINEAVTGKDAASYRYLLCNFEALLYGDGEIVAWTAKGTYDKDANYVKVTAGNTVIVIFRDIQY